MPIDPERPSPRRWQLCSGEHARRVANQLFDQRQENVSIVRTSDPLQPLRVIRSAEVIDPSREIVVVTA